MYYMRTHILDIGTYWYLRNQWKWSVGQLRVFLNIRGQESDPEQECPDKARPDHLTGETGGVLLVLFFSEGKIDLPLW